MQEGTIGWDQVSVNKIMPWYLRLLVLYLFIALVVALIRSIAFIFQLRRGRTLSPQQIAAESAPAKALVLAAFHNQLSRDAINDDLRDLCDLAGISFTYRWHQYLATVHSMKRTVKSALLFSTLAVIVALADLLRATMVQKVIGFPSVAGPLSVTLAYFACGVFVASVIHVWAGFIEGALDRRKATWDSFYARCHAERER